MKTTQEMLQRLRTISVAQRTGTPEQQTGRDMLAEFEASGVRFVASHPAIEDVYYRAVRDLAACVIPSVDGGPMLIEGAIFFGCWLESTGTINTEVLGRFCPETARKTFELFADHIREDGLIPYKLTVDGPVWRQIQIVTPLARSVWTLYRQIGDRAFLQKMYDAIARNDAWLAEHRNTMGTGCVEAFCTFDTGHDASPRFWHCPDIPYRGDPALCDPANPILPFAAPDMTANVYCQRLYLQRMADELGIKADWDTKAEASLLALMQTCYDEEDHFFYDRDKLGRFVRLQSDNLIRVFACEVGNDAAFADALRRYLLNTQKFFCRYPITTIAMDDARFQQATIYNSWAGQPSFLTELRLPAAFDRHGRGVELGWILHPIVTALSRFKKFSGSVNPWMGEEGYSENYTPTMLTLLEYLERLCGIYPRPDDTLWFTAQVPYGTDHDVVAEATGYSRTVDGAHYELAATLDEAEVYKDGALLYRMPAGVRLVTGRDGALQELVGMVDTTVKGTLEYKGQSIPFAVAGNEVLRFADNAFTSVSKPGVIPPSYGA